MFYNRYISEDAVLEIRGLMDDEIGICKIRVGDIYVDVSNDDAAAYVEKQKTSLATDVSALTHKIADIKQQMDELKTQLYSKFGESINLEYDT